MKAANPFDGHDFAGSQKVNAGGHGVADGNLRAIGPREPDPRSADRARIGLRVEAPVRGVVVLPLAGRAHGKLRHRGLRPVVGNAPRNGEARPAVGAVQKRVAEAAVRGVEQLPQAIRAGRRIGRNSGAHLACNLTGNNAKLRPPGKGQFPHRDRVDARQRRRLGAQAAEKGLHALLRSLDFDRHSAGIVADKPRQALFLRQPVDKRPKSHPLHHSAHQHAPPPRQRFVPFSFWRGFRPGS